MACAIVKFYAMHKVKLSVHSRPQAFHLLSILHTPKVCFTCRKAYLIEKEKTRYSRVFSFSGCFELSDTTEMCLKAEDLTLFFYNLY